MRLQTDTLWKIELPPERREFLRQMLAGLALPTLGLGSVQAKAANSTVDPLAVVRWFVDIIIPADGLTPAASSLGVAERIWQESQNDPMFTRLVRYVADWIAQKTSGKFSELSEAQANSLVEWMSKAPWEAPQRRFFFIIRDHAMWFYYAHPESWRGLAIQRPPQPIGYVLE